MADKSGRRQIELDADREILSIKNAYERTLKEEFLATFEKVQQLEDEYKRCEEALANAGEGEQRHSTRETCAYSHAD